MSLIHKYIQNGEYYVIDVNSGALHVVDEIVYDLLDEVSLGEKEELIESLKDKYNVEDIEEAYSEIQSLIQEEMLYTKDLYESIAKESGQAESYIKALCLNVIHDCNLRCKYCFADEGEYHGAREVMSAEVGKKAIDFVLEKSGTRKNIEIDLFGGEPLMAFDMIKEVVEYAKVQEKKYKKSIRFTMTTNATLLNDEIMKYMDENMGNIVLSIDGRKSVNDKVRVRVDGSGSYDRVLPNIKKMVDMRDKSKAYYARGTFTRGNTDFFEDVKHMADLGFKEISIEPVVLPKEHELSIREEDLPVIFEQYDKLYTDMLQRHKDGNEFKFYHFNIDLKGGPCVYKRISGCGAGHEYIAVTPKGEIYPCHQFVGNKDYILGDIYNGITNKKIVQEFKEAHIYNKPTCMQCWAKFYCSGGCQANNFNFNGDMHIPYELGCKMQKKRIECAIALKSKTMNK
ncbi:thioether cross-link-forming SCIFF peptide maturase [Clostridium sp. CM028]|uniref:thioether cross-link-forming SCIFF peptide maturase n=1 Tax=unclassified Clostridium TaxID=2614128 RepID=UPI001C0DC4F5|nr:MULTISPECIES: thioether cross-link-forming SCIFF peptide maturase [unclassified Clostridium]MBU3091903.1 thioether cross-link-forming SCIFF peptide maturase [Clostridium sp. CF011]MBW9147752.1 thioether cross-link-forming SCIFF peptide maturase [Clostridium sp. CM028]WAG70419.1 thioether cross-link-forming SCIFF peptide maturase [Clostridium sp. CF011]WLC62073.1 thioether cross-link-forming SCIFF peptide maturase [Clostridium sp. CM028]